MDYVGRTFSCWKSEKINIILIKLNKRLLYRNAKIYRKIRSVIRVSKIKKTFMTVLILLTVAMTVGAVTVQAYPVVEPSQPYTGLYEDHSFEGTYGRLNTYVQHCAFSASNSSYGQQHIYSGKYAWCAPYTYSGTNYIQGTSKTSGFVYLTPAYTYLDGWITVDSSTAKIEYLGNMYLTSDIGSGVIEAVKIITKISGAP